MQICQTHWDKLIQLVKDNGMWGMVKGSSEEAHADILAEINGEASDAYGFDPLLRANNMIMAQGLEMGGLYLMTGDYCPICEAVKNTASIPLEGQTEPVGEAWVENHWTVGAVESIRDHAMSLGLIGKQ